MLIAVLTLAGLCFIFATLLVLAHRVLHVDEDPRIDAVQLLLPGTNCGACGFPGCLGLSEAIVKGRGRKRRSRGIHGRGCRS
jgi:Na+-translocating ferredoxin:NAD+ oxidoreductase RNF subunit RnfB